MVAWSEYRDTAKARGALALELFVVESAPTSGPDAVKESLPDHLAYQRALEVAGALVLAGPLSDATGEEMQGTGLIVYRAENLEVARAIAEADPMHQSGARRYTLRKWLINEGSLNVNLGLSTGQATLS